MVQLASAPSLAGYQLLVVDATRGHSTRAYSPLSDKKIILYYDEGHYDAITTLHGFFGFSYTCANCFKPYDHLGQHACQVNKDHCSACLQQGCPDHLHCRQRHIAALVSCRKCRRTFFGETCLRHHSTMMYTGAPAASPQASVCTTRTKCLTCRKLLKTAKEQQQHRCGFITCPSCKEYVDAQSHQCYIQIVKSPEEQRREKRKKQKRPRRAAAADVHVDDTDDAPPVHVFFDIEAMQNTGTHIPNLLVAETEHEDRPHHFSGNDCIREFLEWLDELTEDDTRPVTVLAHNFQGYDGYFIVDEYHRQNRTVKQTRNGAKLLQVVHDNITFIDSLSFFAMPLATFPNTFGITKLKKGFFPHLFNTPDHQTYVGPLPPKRDFMPHTMSEKKQE